MQELFEKYRKRLARIGIFKSVIFSLALAFVASGIVSAVTWITKTPVALTLYLTFGIGALIFTIMLFVLYFMRFRPTTRMVAEKLDALGLDDRYITMYEFRDNQSAIAKLQREDAKEKLVHISAKRLKFTVALPVIFLLVFGVLFAAGTTTGSVLAVTNPSGISENREDNDSSNTETKFFTVVYQVFDEGTGTITGDMVQHVESGHFTKPVTATAAIGYRFVAWVDADKNHLTNQNNPRFEVNVQEDMVIYALFEKIDEDDSDGNGNNNEGEDRGDQEPDNEKDEGGDSSGDNDNKGESGEGNPEEGEGSGRENNNVIDGKQNYKDNFDRESLENELGSKDIPDDLKDILGDYYNTLKP